MVPSMSERRSYANMLYDLFGQETGIGPDKIADLCDYVVESNSADVNVMAMLLESDDCPILLRTETYPGYPYPEHIVELCRQFEIYRETVMVGRTERVEEVLWTLGALFRSIKPFNRGSAIIGHLVENGARQKLKMRWRLKPLDQRHFRTYHQTVFCRHYGAYVVPIADGAGA